MIGTSEQRLFAIADTRERADRLQEQLVPKLKSLLGRACDLLREVYGTDVLAPFRTPTTPAHRPRAKKTKPFEMATAGLAVDGQAWFFQQRFECTSDSLRVTFFGLRGLEGNPIVQVLKRHSREVIRLLAQNRYEIRSSAIELSDEDEELDLIEFISKLLLAPEREWVGTFINGPSVDLPIAGFSAAWPVLYDFVALFPLFRAATHVLRGEDDRFQYYAERFWSWKDWPQEPKGDEAPGDCDHVSILRSASPAPSDTPPEVLESAWEGGLKVAIRRHRLREKGLRKRKIREVLRRENGRLSCEVPGCGFDFFAAYGELGRDFAHVHHKNPLSDRTRPELTKLSDLAIVCANCHAMIHRGGRCRALEDLIPHRSLSPPESIAGDRHDR